MTDMHEEKPSACSLPGQALEQRLEEMSALAAGSLLGEERDADRRRLRFRADPETRRRLEALVAAEAECCPFLDLSLTTDGEEIVLTVST